MVGQIRRYIRIRKFRTKLLVSFFFIIALTLALIGGTYYKQMVGDLEESVVQNMLLLLENAGAKMEANMIAIQKQSWDYFGDTDVQQFVASFGEGAISLRGGDFGDKMRTTLRLNDFISGLALYDLEGRVFSKGVLEYSERQNWFSIAQGEQQQMQELALQYNGTGAWRVMKMRDDRYNDEQYTFSLVRAIKRISVVSQRTVGFVRIDLDRTFLMQTLHQLKEQEGGEYYIVNRQGQIVFAEDEGLIGSSLQGQPILSAMEQMEDDSGYKQVQVQGGRFMSVYRQISSTDWMLVGLMPNTRVASSVQAMQSQTMWIAAIVMAISMGIAVLIASSISSPLQTLRKSMKEVEKGHFDTQIKSLAEDEIGVLSVSFNKMVRQINDLIREVYQARISTQQAELHALQLQINPHFLYNALDTVDSLASLNNEPRIGAISRGLSNMFRYSISGSPITTLQEELYQVKQYLIIQQIRFADKFVYDIVSSVPDTQVCIRKLLLQPIVENAFVHGVDKLAEQGFIRIEVESSGSDAILIMVTDNGPGMDEEQLARLQSRLESLPTSPVTEGHGDSVGLLNVARRIQLLYGAHYGITISSECGKGTKVYMTIPIIGKEEQ